MVELLYRRLLVLFAAAALALVGLGGPAFASGHGGHAEKGGHGGGHGAPAAPHGAAAPEAKPDATKAGSNGMELGEFRIRAYHPAESRKSVAKFSLYATTEKDKLADSQHLLENRRHKLRDQVIVVTRMIPLADFNDPQLKSFRRRLLLQLRRTLPELAIENVYISDFELTVERI